VQGSDDLVDGVEIHMVHRPQRVFHVHDRLAEQVRGLALDEMRL